MHAYLYRFGSLLERGVEELVGKGGHLGEGLTPLLRGRLLKNQQRAYDQNTKLSVDVQQVCCIKATENCAYSTGLLPPHDFYRAQNNSLPFERTKCQAGKLYTETYKVLLAIHFGLWV